MICEALKKSYVHKNLHDSFSKKTTQEYSRDRSVRKVPIYYVEI